MKSSPWHRAWRLAGRWWPLVLALILLVPALAPLWQPGLQQTDDGMHHLFRLFNLDLALRAGYWGTRWLADEGFGYGFPVLNFYAPLGYYVEEGFHLLGVGFASSLELSLAAGLVAAALAMYVFARELLGSWGGAIAAIAYAWAPYHLADAWTRGALAEHLALVWLPLLLLALWQVARARGWARLWPTLWGGIAFAALILTHNLTVILASPVLVAWGLFLLGVEVRDWASRGRCLAVLALLAGLGIALSAAFWLPAIGESGDIWAAEVPVEAETWVQALVPPQHLVDDTWTHRYTIAQHPRALHALGQAQVVIAIIGLAVGIWQWRRLKRVTRLALPLFVLLALLALFLQSAWSRPVWESLPGLLLLQFPWRWQAIAALCLAVASGYVGSALTHTTPRILPWRDGGPRESLLPQQAGSPKSPQPRLPKELGPRFRILLFRLQTGTTKSGNREDKPGGGVGDPRPDASCEVKENPAEGGRGLPRLNSRNSGCSVASEMPTVPMGDKRALILDIGKTAAVCILALLLMSSALPNLPWERANLPTTDVPVSDQNVNRSSLASYDYGRGLWLRQYGEPWMFEYMPRWAEALRGEFFVSAGPATSDAKPLAAQVIPGWQAPLERHFKVTSAAPWNLQLHQFYFPGWQAFVDGQSQPVNPSGPLALASVVVPAGEHDVVFRFASTPLRTWGWVLSLAACAASLAGLVWLRRWRWLAGLVVVVAVFAGLAAHQRQTAPSDYLPAPTVANFGGEAQLVGFYAPPDQLTPGADATVTLQWLALRRPEKDYKAFVHLTDADGKLWAQHDGEPGFFFSPTTRWQQGEIIEDRHVLQFAANPPPGHYQLWVGLYDPAENVRLPVLGPDGRAVDNQVLLGEFEIK